MNSNPLFEQEWYAPDLRRVRKLSLRVDHPGREQRGRRMLEEALRLLSLPGENGTRVYYVRNARFPDVYDCDNDWSYAELVSRLCRPMTDRALHFGDKNAKFANVVFARSPVEPWVALMARLARAQECTEWFWPLATPGLDLRAGGAHSLVGALRLFYRQTGSGGMAELLASCQKEVLDILCRRLTAEDAREMSVFPAEIMSTAGGGGVATSVAAISRIVPEPWLGLCRRFLPSWGAGDARSHWLVATSLSVADPGHLLHPEFAVQVAATARAFCGKQPTSTCVVSHHSKLNERNLPYPFLESDQTRLSAGQSSSLALRSSDENEDEALQTGFGGFFFLLRLLDRFGLTRVLKRHPELIDGGLSRLLLQRLLLATGVDRFDPVYSLSWVTAAHETRLPTVASWDFDPAMLPGPFQKTSSQIPFWNVERLLRVWLCAVLRYVRRFTGLPCAQVVRRPASFIATRSHLAIRLPQAALDLRVRRAGLDIDPGWLPWLGKVVRFEYSCQTVALPPELAGDRTLRRKRDVR